MTRSEPDQDHAMTAPSHEPPAPLQIQNACPKSWGELTGSGKQRFCSSCSLHVHDGAQLTQKEAETIVSTATARVCMRLQYDAAGAPVFRDTPIPASSDVRAPLRPLGRVARWFATAAAGVLAACHGNVSTPATSDPAGGTDGAQPPSRMGKVCVTEKVGDVAVPLPQGIERLGEVSVPPAPIRPEAPAPQTPVAPPPTPVDAPDRDGE
jgi:hypothetical protein